MADEVFGKFDVKRGERCSNGPHEERWTTPCCYADILDRKTKECPDCGAPVVCEIEQVPIAVCRIPDADV